MSPIFRPPKIAIELSTIKALLCILLPKLLWNGNFNLPVTTFYRIAQADVALKGDRQKQIFELISAKGPLTRDDLKKGIDQFTSSPLASLVKKKVIEVLKKAGAIKLQDSIPPGKREKKRGKS